MAAFGPSHRPPVLAKSSPFWPRSCQVGDPVFLLDRYSILWLHRGTGAACGFSESAKMCDSSQTLVTDQRKNHKMSIYIFSKSKPSIFSNSRCYGRSVFLGFEMLLVAIWHDLTPFGDGSAQAQKRLHPRATAKSRRWSKWTRKNCRYLLVVYPP